MGTTADKLNYLNQTKEDIKNALIDKGIIVNDGETFRSYAEKIRQITSGGIERNIFIQKTEPEKKRRNMV